MNVKLPIYLDNSATTPVDPRVVEKMLPYLTERFGNPASTHAFGNAVRDAVEEARAQVAALVNSERREIVWTSGATESNNLALKGAAYGARAPGRHCISLQTEHKAVLDTMHDLERNGFELERRPADAQDVAQENRLEGVFRRFATQLKLVPAVSAKYK